jgi:hypothetical protein
LGDFSALQPAGLVVVSPIQLRTFLIFAIFSTYTWKDGRQYRGEWRNDMKHGQGIEILSNGTIWHEGQWLDDKPIRYDQDLLELVKDDGVSDSISVASSSITMTAISNCNVEGDKGIYTGDVLRSTGMPHGVGRMVYEGGTMYEGDWYVST